MQGSRSLVRLMSRIFSSNFTSKNPVDSLSAKSIRRALIKPVIADVHCNGWGLRCLTSTEGSRTPYVRRHESEAVDQQAEPPLSAEGGAALAGAAAGSDVLRGFPTIWAQEIKDIELRHVGVSYSVVKAIGDQASKDLGFKVTMQNLDTSASINRFVTQPNTRRHRRPRRLAGQARHQARRAPGHRGQEDQGVRQHPADLHQGRTRRPGGLAPGHLALRGDVHRPSPTPPSSTRA